MKTDLFKRDLDKDARLPKKMVAPSFNCTAQFKQPGSLNGSWQCCAADVSLWFPHLFNQLWFSLAAAMFTSFITMKAWYAERNKFILTSSALNHTRTECKTCVKIAKLWFPLFQYNILTPLYAFRFPLGFIFVVFPVRWRFVPAKINRRKDWHRKVQANATTQFAL